MSDTSLDICREALRLERSPVYTYDILPGDIIEYEERPYRVINITHAGVFHSSLDLCMVGSDQSRSIDVDIVDQLIVISLKVETKG